MPTDISSSLYAVQAYAKTAENIDLYRDLGQLRRAHQQLGADYDALVEKYNNLVDSYMAIKKERNRLQSLSAQLEVNLRDTSNELATKEFRLELAQGAFTEVKAERKEAQGLSEELARERDRLDAAFNDLATTLTVPNGLNRWIERFLQTHRKGMILRALRAENLEEPKTQQDVERLAPTISLNMRREINCELLTYALALNRGLFRSWETLCVLGGENGLLARHRDDFVKADTPEAVDDLFRRVVDGPINDAKRWYPQMPPFTGFNPWNGMPQPGSRLDEKTQSEGYWDYHDKVRAEINAWLKNRGIGFLSGKARLAPMPDNDDYEPREFFKQNLGKFDQLQLD